MPVSDNPPQDRTLLLWLLGSIPGKFNHSSVGGLVFPEWLEVDVESRFQSLPFPTYLGKHVHICMHTNNFVYGLKSELLPRRALQDLDLPSMSVQTTVFMPRKAALKILKF